MAKTSAQRQAEFRARQRATGKKERIVWVHEADWQAGFDAGLAGKPSFPVPAGWDELSWLSGYIEGKQKGGRPTDESGN